MSALSRLIPVLAAGAIALAVACGGDSTGPSAASVTGIAGDNQEALTGTPLAFPLSFVVLSAGGTPLQGVTVNWTVTPTGGATFSPASGPTNAQGTAQTNVTLGSFVGDVVIRGNVPGIQPVVFHALAIDPCTYAEAHTVGGTINGVLTTADCRQGGNYFTDFYEFTVSSQQGVTATMTATTFDAWLDVYKGSNGAQMAAANDIAPGNTNARVDLIVAPGTYVLAPNTRFENVTGNYTLTSAVRAQTLAGCDEEVWVTRNVTITDNLVATDCPDTTASGVFYADLVGIIAFANDTLRFTQRSTTINPMLTLYRIDPGAGFVVVATNDDSAGTTTDAFINFPVTQDAAVYVLAASTAGPASTGVYTLTVGGSASLGVARRPLAGWGATGARVFGPLGLPKTHRRP